MKISINERIMATLYFFQLFASFLTSSILLLLPNIVTYKQFVTLIAISSSVLIIYNYFIDRKVRKGLILTLFLCLILIILFLFTSSLFISKTDKFVPFLLVLTGQTTPALLVTVIVARNHAISFKMKQLVPFYSILFTIVSFFAAFFPTDMTSGGFSLNENGMNYQSTAYMASYSTGFVLYYLLLFRKISWVYPFKYSQMRWLMVVVVFINFLTLLIAGGRGGFALFVVVVLFSVYYIFTSQYLNRTLLIKRILSLSILVIVGYFCFLYAKDAVIETSGLSRIIGIFQDPESRTRGSLWTDALSYYGDSPLWGHGLGAIFFLLGEYSHNIFIDILVESGILGEVIFVLLLLVFFKFSVFQIRKDKTNIIWIFIFFDGFIMSLFSGYYLANIPLLCAFSFALLYKKNSNKKFKLLY